MVRESAFDIMYEGWYCTIHRLFTNTAHGCYFNKKRGSHMSEKKLEIFGWVGTALSIIMYVSYIPQIIHNLNGIKGTPIQPFAAALSSD